MPFSIFKRNSLRFSELDNTIFWLFFMNDKNCFWFVEDSSRNYSGEKNSREILTPKLRTFLLVKSKNYVWDWDRIFSFRIRTCQKVFLCRRSEGTTFMSVKNTVYLRKGHWDSHSQKDKCGSWHKTPDDSPTLGKMQMEVENTKFGQTSTCI